MNHSPWAPTVIATRSPHLSRQLTALALAILGTLLTALPERAWGNDSLASNPLGNDSLASNPLGNDSLASNPLGNDSPASNPLLGNDASGNEFLAETGPHVALHGRTQEGPLGREWSAGLTLSLPWEIGLARLPSPRSPKQRKDAPWPTLRTLAQDPSSARPADAPAGGSGSTSAPKPQEPQEPQEPPAERVVSATLVQRTVQMALRLAGFSGARRRLDSLARRSRHSAFLPELRLRGGRSADQLLRLTPTESEPTRYVQSGQAGAFFDAQLIWRLHRLAFADEELRVESLREHQLAERTQLIHRIVTTLLKWERARLNRLDAELPEEKRRTSLLDQLEAELILDVLTGARFSPMVGRHSVQRSP